MNPPALASSRRSASPGTPPASSGATNAPEPVLFKIFLLSASFIRAFMEFPHSSPSPGIPDGASTDELRDHDFDFDDSRGGRDDARAGVVLCYVLLPLAFLLCSTAPELGHNNLQGKMKNMLLKGAGSRDA